MTIPPSSASDAFSVALRLLGRCDRSEAQIREKLKQRGFSSSAIATAIERCYDYRYLDDRRYALGRARSLMCNGKGVGGRILADLRQRGITDELARAALDEVSSEFRLEDLFHQELSRRFPNFCYGSASANERRRLINYFQRRGFALCDIFTWLQQTSVSDR
ncbi:regulatory protein RecX [Pelovirga terrestris]|uniref:Regulatory protein RecX n=1 Tax=Pelovirga terrestris TaxID=2771352 RepID=A0A8J6QT53_9BACT|nr:regulatory protein RecX [Pelovirga terrestris]MBD1401515.1 regulatory protein RecX [Pelovirga terrestris]